VDVHIVAIKTARHMQTLTQGLCFIRKKQATVSIVGPECGLSGVSEWNLVPWAFP
jgi:hypothetical protein